jgi:hypothetical protein
MAVDYFRKMYLENTTYPSKMRTVPEKYHWNKILQISPALSEFADDSLMRYKDAARRRYELFLKQSEFKKPYLASSYPEMERGMPYVPRDNPPFDWPPGDGPCNPEVEDCGGPLSQVCDLDHSGGFCPGNANGDVVSWTASRNVLFFTITYKSDPSTYISPSGGGTSGTWTIYAGAGEHFITIEATMESDIPGQSCSSNVNVTSKPQSECCPSESTLSCDEVNTPTTISQSSSVTVYFDNSKATGPYTWAVVGTGFTLDSASTSGLTNGLNASASACGVAYVTITDSCGNTATCAVRCPDSGSWVLIASGASAYCACSGTHDYQSGSSYYKSCREYRQRVDRQASTYGSSTCPSTCDNSDRGCNKASYVATCKSNADSGTGLCNDYVTDECIILPLYGIYNNQRVDWCIDGTNATCLGGSCIIYWRCQCNGYVAVYEWQC